MRNKVISFLNSNSFSLLLMITISLITQVLTIAKSSIIAGTFGLSIEMDAYNFANSIASFLFGLIAGGVPTIIIPSYVKKEKKEGVNGFLTFIYGILFLIILIFIFLRYQIVSTFSNQNELFVNIACNLLIILLLSQYLMSITNITVAYFQCTNKYNTPKIISLFSQILVIILLVFFKNLSIYTYAWILTIGIVFNFLIDITVACRYGWRFYPFFNFNNVDVKKIIHMFLPIVLSSSVYNISLFVDSTIASRLDTGKLTILSYSNQISGIVNTVLIGNLLIYIYPKIIRQIEDQKDQSIFWNQINLFHSITLLVTIGFFAIGKEGISLLFGHGLFNEYAVESVYYGTSIYIFGMQTNVIRDLLYRYFYSIGDTKTPANNSILISLLNIVISIILVYKLGFYGIILGTVIASFISMGVIFIKFKNKVGINENVKLILLDFFKNIFISSIVMIIVLYTKNILCIDNQLISIIFFGFETLLCYILFLFLFSKKTLRTLSKI